MGDTKERILLTALQLFARDGYEAVSVRTIAEELGMTKGALYRHYKNKRDIFDSIVERMIQIDAKRAEEYQVPTKQYEVMPDAYENTSMDLRHCFAGCCLWSNIEIPKWLSSTISVLLPVRLPIWRICFVN